MKRFRTFHFPNFHKRAQSLSQSHKRAVSTEQTMMPWKFFNRILNKMSQSTRSKKLHRMRKTKEYYHHLSLICLEVVFLNPWSKASARVHNTNSQFSRQLPLIAFTPLCLQFKNQACRRLPVLNSEVRSHCNQYSLKNLASHILIQWHKSHQDCQRLSSLMEWALISRTTVWSKMKSLLTRASSRTCPTKV